MEVVRAESTDNFGVQVFINKLHFRVKSQLSGYFTRSTPKHKLARLSGSSQRRITRVVSK